MLLLRILAFFASAALLTLIHPPIGFSALAWFALVPFILACAPDAKIKPLLLSAYVISFFYWLINLYWIVPITVLGWLAFCLYTALLWPILALCLRTCRKKKIPLFIAAPILLVGAERLQGFLLGGFFWRYLAHSQYANLTIIQIADIFGAAGVSFLVAMVNGLIAELLIAAKEKKLLKPNIFIKTALIACLVIAAVLYGNWRIKQSKNTVHPGPEVAAIQSNVPQSVKRSFQNAESIFKDLTEQSQQALKFKPALIVWPETMVQAILDKQIWPILKSPEDNIEFHNKLSRLARDKACLLVGAYGGKLLLDENSIDYPIARYNSAFLYHPDGKQDPKRYDKIHLVPFGEFIPFRKTWPGLFKILMKFTPYNYDYSIEPGTQYTIFNIKPENQKNDITYNFGVMICYEDTVPEIAGKFTLDENGNKRLDWLVNISNDGWFVRFKDEKILPSTELAQHAAICAFRAVENRVSIIRSVNAGISCLIDTNGRIKNGFSAGNLPKKAMERTGCSGWFVARIPIDDRITFFSKTGQWLSPACALCLVLIVIISIKKTKN